MLSLISLLSITARGQITNCPGAQVICSDSAILFTPFGVGSDDFNNPNNDPGCLLTGENESAWYYFAFNELMPPNSVIEFTIDPNGGANEDYDFAIYGPYLGCDSLGEPVRCSFANILCTFCPQTGLGMGATDASEGAMNEDGFVLPMVVQPGEGYYLLLDNWYGSSNGFQLTWGGSAAPFLNCLADPDCSTIRIEAGNDLSFCDAPATPVTLQGSASGYSAAATFAWSAPGGETAFLSDTTLLQPTLTLPPGFTGSIPYTLTVTDGTCTKSSRLNVQVGNLIQVDITGTTQICQGDTTTLSVAGTWTSLTWSTNADSAVISAFEEGVYAVEVSDGSGCTGTDSVTVAFIQVNTAISGGTNLCAGDTLTLQAAPGMMEYTWSDMSADSMLVVTASGIYALTVTDTNGCTAESSVTVTDRPLPVPVLAGPTGVCPGNSATLSLQSAYAEYLWSDMSTSDTLLVNAAGTFSVIVTDTFGCQGTATYNLLGFPAPVVAISGDADFCENESTLLTATAGFAAYTWTGGSNNQTLSVNTAANHGVTATDSNGCIATANFLTTILPLPVLNINTTAEFCAGSTVSLDAGPGFSTYQWLPGGQATQTISVGAVGTYQLSVTDANGCMASSAIDVQANPLPVPQISGTAGFCAGSATTLSAPGTWSNYTWTGGVSNTDLIVSNAGIYGLTVTDGLGCEGTAQITVEAWTNPQPVISAPASVCPGGTAQLDAGGPYAQYLWTGGSTNSTLLVSTGGLYNVTVTDANGCTGTDQIKVHTLNNVTQTAVEAIQQVSSCGGNDGSISLRPLNGTPPYTFLWPAGSLTGITGVGTINGLMQGSYRITVTDATNAGCSMVMPQIVLNAPGLEVSLDTIIHPACPGALTGSIVLDVNGQSPAFLWSNQQTGSTAIGLGDGQYSVTITDGNCTQTLSNLDVVAPPPIDIKLNKLTHALCSGNSNALIDLAIFGATPPYSFIWSNDSTAEDLINISAGAYQCTITDAQNCFFQTPVYLVNEPPLLTIQVDSLANVRCFGEKNGYLRIKATGGTAP
ncbi:MAG: hypothetical protein HUU01_18070, partial [Saprospiraceae bacterium]|nr:hypothetical protein [Saprospiraceae bacterium]